MKLGRHPREKLTRFSIRKYHFGAASVAVASLLFFGNGTVQAAENASAATDGTHQRVAGGGGDSSGESGTPDASAATTAAAQVTPTPTATTVPQPTTPAEGEDSHATSKTLTAGKNETLSNSEGNKPNSDSASKKEKAAKEEANEKADVTALRKKVAELKDKLSKLTDKNVKERFAALVTETEKVAEDHETTQDKANQQLDLVENAIKEVDDAIKKESKKEENKPKPLPTYKNGIENWALAGEMRDIFTYMKANGADADKVAAIKANYDKLNEKLGLADEDGVLSAEDFATATANLTAARDAIEKFLENKVVVPEVVPGEVPGTVRSEAVRPEELRRGRRSIRSVGPVGQDRDGSNDYKNSREYYFEDGRKGVSPYDRYTYVFYTSRQSGVAWDGVRRSVDESRDFIYAHVTPTSNGFKWDIYINRARHDLSDTVGWFTLPKGTNVVGNSVTISWSNSEGNHAISPNDGRLETALSQAGLSMVTKGTTKDTGIDKRNSGYSKSWLTNDLKRLATQGGVNGNNPYKFDLLNNDSDGRALQDAKINAIYNNNGDLYYFQQGADRTAYHLSFETTGITKKRDLIYAVGMKGERVDNTAQPPVRVRFIANQWSAKTALEKTDADEYSPTITYPAYIVKQGEYKNQKYGYNEAWFRHPERTDKLLNYGDQSYTKSDFDANNYYHFEARNGKSSETILYEADARGFNKNFRMYKPDGTEISKHDMGNSGADVPGDFEYTWKWTFTDNSKASEHVRFIVVPKEPRLVTDLTNAAGRKNVEIKAANGTNGFKMELYRKVGGVLTKVSEAIAGANGEATFTLDNNKRPLILEVGDYVVKTVADLNEDYKDYAGITHKQEEGLRSGESNVVTATDGAPPVVRMIGSTDPLPDTRPADNAPAVYEVTQGQPFAPRLEAFDNLGVIKKFELVDFPAPLRTPFKEANSFSEANSYEPRFNGNIPANTEPGVYTRTIKVSDGVTGDKTYYFKYKVLPVAPTITTPQNQGGTLVSTDRSISGTGIAGSTITVTLQDGTTGTTTVDNQGNWTYTLKQNEKLTQNTKQDANTKADRGISITQSKNGAESRPATVDVQLARAISIDTPVQAGRDITVKVPHDAGLLYVQVKNGNNTVYEYGVRKVGNSWQITDTAKANLTELRVTDGKNVSEKVLTFHIKDPKNNIPFTLSATNDVTMRVHYDNNVGNPSDPTGENAGWVTAAKPTNTAPTITVNAPDTHNYTADGSLTMAGLKGLVTVADAEDDVDKTVGNRVGDNFNLTIRKGNQNVTLSGNDYLKKGEYTLTYTTADAAGARVERTHNITVSSLAESKGASITYPLDTAKVVYGNSDVTNGNFTPAIKKTFADKLTEVNRNNNTLPTINGTGVTFAPGTTNNKSEVVVATFPDGSTLPISHDKVAKPEAPTITPTPRFDNDLSSTERSISGTGIAGATVKIALQDGKNGETTVGSDGRWTYNLKAGETLKQNFRQDATTKATSPVSVKQVANGIESAATTANVRLSDAASFDTPLQAGRDITVHVPHDAGKFYVVIASKEGHRFQYGVMKTASGWQVEESVNDRPSGKTTTELTEEATTNPSERVFKLHIKDSNQKTDIPFTMKADARSVMVRVHYDNSAGNTASGWIFAPDATNTNPTITVKAPNTHNYAADGSLTMAGLKNLVTVADTEDDANKTVGNTASDNLNVTIRKGTQNVTLSGNEYLKKGDYTLTYTTTDAAGATVNVTHNITVNYTAEAKPTINLLQGESLTEAQKRSLLQLQDGTSKIDVPSDAKVEVALDTTSVSNGKTASATVVFADKTRTSPVTINYNVLPTFPVATTVYDFAGVARNQNEGAYYSNPGNHLPPGFDWFVRQNGTAKPTGRIQDYLRDDRVGTTDYVYGAKYREGRFSNNASESDRLEHSGTISHTVFDVGANTTRIMVNSGGTLTDDQARTAVMPINNSAALPSGTTYEWVTENGNPLTDKTVTEKGEATRYVKVTLPKTAEDGPAATQYRSSKIVRVTINESVKPTVSFDGSALSTDARNEAAKFVIFRGATFNPTFTVNDNSGKVSYLKVSGLPSGKDFEKTTETANGDVQITGNEITATSNASLGDHIGKVLVKDASGNEQEYQFKYTVVDIKTVENPKTVSVNSQLGDSHFVVKLVTSDDTGATSQEGLYPTNTKFKWKKDNAEVQNSTTLNSPGRVTGYRAVVESPANRAGFYTKDGVKFYMPASIERDVTFLVKPTAPTVTAANNGDVTITPVNEPNVNKVEVTYTPADTNRLEDNGNVTKTPQDRTKVIATKGADNQWTITSGGKDGIIISINATTGAITLKDQVVKDQTSVEAKVIAQDIESDVARGDSKNGESTAPVIGANSTLVKVGEEFSLPLGLTDAGVGVDDTNIKVSLPNGETGLTYDSKNQLIRGTISAVAKKEITVRVLDKNGNKAKKTISIAAVQPKPIYAIKDGTIPNVDTPSNFVEIPTGVTNPSVAWKDSQPSTATAGETRKTVTVSANGYTSTEVDVPVTVYPGVTYRKVNNKEVTEYDEIVGQPLTSSLVPGGGRFNPVTPDYYLAFENGTKPAGTRVEFEGGTPAERSTTAGVTAKTIVVTYPHGAGIVKKTVTFKTYGNEANYETGKDSIETTVGTEFSKLTARNSVKLSDPNVPNPNDTFIGWYRNGNYTPENKIGKRNENVNVWYGYTVKDARGDGTNNYNDQNITVNVTVKPQAPTIAEDALYGKGTTKPNLTVGNLPTNSQLETGASVTVELFQGNKKVASKTVNGGISSVEFNNNDYSDNLTYSEKVHAVVKVAGGTGTTAYNLSSANSNGIQVTPQKPTFDTATVTSTSRTLSGTLGGFDATNRVVKVHLNDEKNTVLSSENNGGVTINGNTWKATLPATVKLRQSVAKNGETTTPPAITVENTVTGGTVSTTSDNKQVEMGAYSVSPAIAGSKHIDITVPHDAKRVELRFHNNQETGDKPNSIVLVRGTDGWHTEATRADNTSVTDANGYVGTITSTPSTANPAENVITIPLNEEINGKKLHIREEVANGDNTATYGKGLGLRVEYQPEAGQDPTAAGNWKVVNVTNDKPTLTYKGTEGSTEANRKVFPSGTSITKAMLENLVTVGDTEDKAADTNNKPYGTPTVEIVSGLTETPGQATPAGRYTVVLKSVDSQGKESDPLIVYVGVVSTVLKYQPKVDGVAKGDAKDITVPADKTHQGDSVSYTPEEITVGGKVYKPVTPGTQTVTLTDQPQTVDVEYVEVPEYTEGIGTTGDGQQRPATPSDDTNRRPDTAIPAEVPAAQPAEQPSQTVEVPAQLPNEVSETNSQPQAVLPNTGTKADRATGALGVLSLLGAFGLLFAKKKKDDEEEA